MVLLYASKYHDIKTVVNISSRYDLKTGVKERLGEDFMERIKKDGFIDVQKSGNKPSVHFSPPFTSTGYHLLISFFFDHLRTSTSAGNILYRVTEASLMDRLNTNMHEACLQIDKGCR